MADDQRTLFVKFRIDPASPDFPRGLKASFDKASVDAWTGKKRRKIDQLPEDDIRDDKEFLPFQNLMDYFYSKNEMFYVVAPYILGIVPLMTAIELEQEVRQFTARHASRSTLTEEYETYELSEQFFSEFLKRLQGHIAHRKGQQILPGIFFLGLTSSYDAFTAEVMRTILNTKPDIISSTEKSITLSDLIEINSVEAARQRLIEREIDAQMRSSHAEQIKWIEKHAKLNIRENNSIWPSFIELFERRNLVSHTNGIVSQQYINVCLENSFDVSNVKIGESRGITPTYLSESVDLLLEFGVKLIQVVWRKGRPLEVDDAAKELNITCYKLITKKRYDIAARLLKWGLFETKKCNERTHKMMVVNYANAVKLNGDKDESLKILDREDWSAANASFRICVMAVRDDLRGVVSMMKATTPSDLPRVEDFREWAVFEPLRSSPEFIEAFQTTFGQQLVQNIDQSTPASDTGVLPVEPGEAAD